MQGIRFQQNTNALRQSHTAVQPFDALLNEVQGESNNLVSVLGITETILQLCGKQVLVFLLILSNIYKNLRRSKFETIYWTDAYLRITEKPTSLYEGRGLALWVFYHKTVILWLTNLGFCHRTTKRLVLTCSLTARSIMLCPGAHTAFYAPFLKRACVKSVINGFTKIHYPDAPTRVFT